MHLNLVGLVFLYSFGVPLSTGVPSVVVPSMSFVHSPLASQTGGLHSAFSQFTGSWHG